MIEKVMQFNSLSAAFLQVKENKGCVGVDGVTIEAFEEELNKNLSILDE